MVTVNQIKLGDIFYVSLSKEDDVTPKGGLDHRYKYCIVVGFSEYGFYVVYFLMNSHINTTYLNTYDRLSCQYPLTHRDYPTIIRKDKDPSFLDLGHPREIEKQRLVSEGRYIGKLTDSDYKNIFEWLRDSEQYSPKLKKRYGWI
ncbi:MAG: hypothetical protein K2J63_04890 [Muribaculaceae bacterium]|nr:hypothetical protein [Muribaculaceae bacterium]MDE6794624.1 hypothetical protein [Muribaculaceae bacterium]